MTIKPAATTTWFRHRRSRVGGAILLSAAVLGLAALGAGLFGGSLLGDTTLGDTALGGGAPGWQPLAPLRRLAVWGLSYRARQARAAAGGDLRSFAHLAASQVGYGALSPKAFSSPSPFTSFTVVDEDRRQVAWRGAGPTRQIPTDLLGPANNVWVGDFTPLATPGRYHIAADNGFVSHPFSIGATVFDGAIRAVQRAFYFQRAFTEISAVHAEGPWTHSSDASSAPTGERHGWHDAGDFSLYNTTGVSSLFWLLEAYSDFGPTGDDTNIPESRNGFPDLLDEARWELDWLQSVQESAGGFRNTTCLSEYRAYGDNAPERAGRYARGEVGTLPRARAVGIAAYASVVYAPLDAAFAQQLRDAAWRGWRYLEARPDQHSDGPTCPAYRQDGDRGSGRAVRMFAAAGMLVATGDGRFRDAFEAHFDAIESDPSTYRFNAYACLLYLRATAGDAARKAAIRRQVRQHADRALLDARAHPFEWAGRYFWGSIGAGFERTGAFNAKLCQADPDREAAHCAQALANLHYALGRNYYQFVYVTGIPGATEGRQHAFHHWLATLRATPYAFPGMVAGGPNEHPEPNDESRPRARPIPAWGYWGDPAMPRDGTTPIDGRYTDNDSWSTNEIDIGWQAVTLYSLYFGQWSARQGSSAAARQTP